MIVASLDHTLYNYAFYLFAAAFNRFLHLYVALFMLVIFALIFGLAKRDVNAISHNFPARTPVKWINGYMLFVAVGLSGAYIVQIFEKSCVISVAGLKSCHYLLIPCDDC
jgi:hypothetical protein